MFLWHVALDPALDICEPLHLEESLGRSALRAPMAFLIAGVCRDRQVRLRFLYDRDGSLVGVPGRPGLLRDLLIVVLCSGPVLSADDAFDGRLGSVGLAEGAVRLAHKHGPHPRQAIH